MTSTDHIVEKKKIKDQMKNVRIAFKKGKKYINTCQMNKTPSFFAIQRRGRK